MNIKLSRIIKYLPQLVYHYLHDLLMFFYLKSCGEDYIGVYIKPMSKAEKEVLFDDEVAGCAYCGRVFMKIWFGNEWFTEQAVIDMLVHESLHQALRKVDEDASFMLNNIHDQKFTIYGFRIDFIV